MTTPRRFLRGRWPDRILLIVIVAFAAALVGGYFESSSRRQADAEQLDRIEFVLGRLAEADERICENGNQSRAATRDAFAAIERTLKRAQQTDEQRARTARLFADIYKPLRPKDC